MKVVIIRSDRNSKKNTSGHSFHASVNKSKNNLRSVNDHVDFMHQSLHNKDPIKVSHVWITYGKNNKLIKNKGLKV